MRINFGTRTIEIAALDPALDREFINLHRAPFELQPQNLPTLEAAASSFFTGHPNEVRLHDAYFSNFTVIWRHQLQAGKFGLAEQVWEIAFRPAMAWEAVNQGRFLHKGTGYYFWGMTSLLRGVLDRGYALMHQALEEDTRTTGRPNPDTPAFALATLNYDKTDQAFHSWVLGQANYLRVRVTKYSSTYHRHFELDEFKRKFLASPPSIDVSFLFAHTLARIMAISGQPNHTLRNQFAAQLEANILFDITLVLDAAIKARNLKKWRFIDHAEFLTARMGQPLNRGQLTEINEKYQADFETTLSDNLAAVAVLSDGTRLTKLQSDVAVAYGIRNRGAHDVSSVATIRDHFLDIEQAILNCLFAAVDDP